MLKTCLYQKSKHSKKINQNSKDRLMVIMASLLVKSVGKFALQTESSQRDLRIRLNYFKLLRSEFRKGNYKSFFRKFHVDFKFVRITEIRIRESRL